VTPHMYQEDTRRKDPRHAFLGGGSVPLGLDEDDPTITAVTTTMADKHNVTYKILNW
jgi:hypothetical protein